MKMTKDKVFCYKVHHIDEERILVAFCDKDLLGKNLEEGKVKLFVDPDFYNDKEGSEEEIVEVLKGPKVYIINAIGKNSIDLLVKNNFGSEEKVLKIKDVPYLQIVYI